MMHPFFLLSFSVFAGGLAPACKPRLSSDLRATADILESDRFRFLTRLPIRHQGSVEISSDQLGAADGNGTFASIGSGNVKMLYAHQAGDDESAQPSSAESLKLASTGGAPKLVVSPDRQWTVVVDEQMGVILKSAEVGHEINLVQAQNGGGNETKLFANAATFLGKNSAGASILAVAEQKRAVIWLFVLDSEKLSRRSTLPPVGKMQASNNAPGKPYNFILGVEFKPGTASIKQWLAAAIEDRIEFFEVSVNAETLTGKCHGKLEFMDRDDIGGGALEGALRRCDSVGQSKSPRLGRFTTLTAFPYSVSETVSWYELVSDEYGNSSRVDKAPKNVKSDVHTFYVGTDTGKLLVVDKLRPWMSRAMVSDKLGAGAEVRRGQTLETGLIGANSSTYHLYEGIGATILFDPLASPFLYNLFDDNNNRCGRDSINTNFASKRLYRSNQRAIRAMDVSAETDINRHQYVVLSAGDGSIRYVNVGTPTLRHTMATHPRPKVPYLNVTRLFVGDEEKAQTIGLAQSLTFPHAQVPGGVSFINAQRDIAFGSGDGYVYIWRPRRMLQPLEISSDVKSPAITSLQFSNNGNLIASGNANGHIAIWDFRNRNEAGSAQDAKHIKASKPIYGLDFSPDDRLVLYVDSLVYAWDIASADEGSGQTLTFGNAAYTAAAFSRDGKYVFAGREDGGVDLFETSSPSAAPARTFKPSANKSAVRAIAPYPVVEKTVGWQGRACSSCFAATLTSGQYCYGDLMNPDGVICGQGSALSATPPLLDYARDGSSFYITLNGQPPSNRVQVIQDVFAHKQSSAVSQPDLVYSGQNIVGVRSFLHPNEERGVTQYRNQVLALTERHLSKWDPLSCEQLLAVPMPSNFRATALGAGDDYRFAAVGDAKGGIHLWWVGDSYEVKETLEFEDVVIPERDEYTPPPIETSAPPPAPKPMVKPTAKPQPPPPPPQPNRRRR